MKFHWVASALFAASLYLVYLLIYGFQTELRNARPQIQQEAVKALKQEKKIKSSAPMSEYINKNLIIQPKPQPTKEDKVQVAEVPRENSNAMDDTEPALRYGQDGSDYWCRPVPVAIETSPVKCRYQNSCYGCQGPIIRPEVADATPLCANGSMSQLYDVECCPQFNNGMVECPSASSCFHAANPPSDFCSCNDRAECKLVEIGSKIQCVCIQ